MTNGLIQLQQRKSPPVYNGLIMKSVSSTPYLWQAMTVWPAPRPICPCPKYPLWAETQAIILSGQRDDLRIYESSTPFEAIFGQNKQGCDDKINVKTTRHKPNYLYFSPLTNLTFLIRNRLCRVFSYSITLFEDKMANS